MENFDDFYGSVFGYRWKNMRIAMLCERKYIALVNTFGDTEKTIELMKASGAINIRNLLKNIHNAKPEFLDNENQNFDAKLTDFIQSKTKHDELYKGAEQSFDFDHKIQVNYAQSMDQILKENAALQNDRLIKSENTGPLYEFIPATKIKGMEDFVFESDHYRYYSNKEDFPLEFTKDTKIHYPENLHVYTYEKGSTATYKPPKRGNTDVFSHYLLDGASLLPVIALDIRPGDKVLDACAAPGGKSLIMAQTLYPQLLVCNDISESRLNRLKSVMKDFICNFHETWLEKRIFITQSNAINMTDHATFDKILVDAPCTTDRYAMTVNENNFFKPTRIKERLKLPETQSAILMNCIQMLKPGGSLVYSTCSLSPVQNDGVVHMALSRLFKEHGITVTIQ